MNIIKSGKGGLSFTNITKSELDALYDALNNTRVQFFAMIKMNDSDLIKSTGVAKQHVKELRDVLQDKVDFYERNLPKLKKHING